VSCWTMIEALFQDLVSESSSRFSGSIRLLGFTYTTSYPNIFNLFRTGCPIRLRDWTWCPFFRSESSSRLRVYPDLVSAPFSRFSLSRTWCPYCLYGFFGIRTRTWRPYRLLNSTCSNPFRGFVSTMSLDLSIGLGVRTIYPD
jgi:hypothetical protein